MIGRLLRNFDMFGHPVGFKVQNDSSKYRTGPGGLLSLMLVAWVAVLIMYRVRQLRGEENIFFTNKEVEKFNKTSQIGSMMAADIMLDPAVERPSLSLKDMKLLPYVLVYDVKTDMPADLSKINEDGSNTLDFQKYGDLYFQQIVDSKTESRKVSLRECKQEDFGALQARQIFEAEQRNGATGGNFLCPEDLSLLQAQNS